MHKPIYHKKDANYRVCWMPGRQWQAQFKVTDAKGTKRTAEQPHFDPWQPLHGGGTLQAAQGVMIMHGGKEL